MTLRVLIVDDEPPARRLVRDFLADEAGVEVAGEAGDGAEALLRIADDAPDVVFLDVQMPEMDGFEVLRSLPPERAPAVVFTTAYDEFAVAAFEASAVDYLLKPLRRDRVHDAVQRARARVAQGSDATLLAELRELVAASRRPARPLERLAVRVGPRIVFLRAEEVDRVEAEGNYARVFAGGRSYLLRQTLSSLEAGLDPDRFMRVHRSMLVNVERIREVYPLARGTYELVLQDGTALTTGQSYRDRVQRLIGAAH